MKIIKILGLVLCFFIIFFICKTAVKNEVSKQTQEIQENNAKEIANLKLKCETEKLEQEKELKTQIIELQTELEKTKILLEKIEKRGKITDMIKKDVKTFINEFDGMLNLKGKTNEK